MAQSESGFDQRNSPVIDPADVPHRLDWLRSQEANLEAHNNHTNHTTNDGEAGHEPNNNQIMEDQAVSYAIEVSLAEQASRTADDATTTNATPQTQTQIRDKDLQKDMVDYVEGMCLRTSNEFPVLDDPQADTLVYIGPPPHLPRQSHSEYLHIKHHFEQPLFVRSANLKALQSKYFDDLLGPKSIRTEKRLRKHGVLNKVAPAKLKGIKYFVDLQPKIEDDEGAFLVADLTCTTGVLRWHHAQKKYKIPGSMVLGTDRFDTPENPYYHFTNFRTSNVSNTDGEGNTRGPGKEAVIAAALDKEATQEYCQLRHRSGIERLLQAIEGKDPKLDSAPKVWTYFALAKFFHCANQDVVRKWVLSWLYHHANANFVQSNPETVYRMGMGIEDADTVWDAYSILVGEKALIMVYGEARPDIYSPLVRSVHGRPLVDLEDNERDRISHAASSLVQRIREEFASLTRSTLWLNDSREFNKLDQLQGRDDAHRATLGRVKSLIADFIRGKIHWVLCQTLMPFKPPAYDLDQNPNGIDAFHFGVARPFCEVYNILNQPMRLFTRTLWMALQRTRFEYGQLNTGANGTPGGDEVSHLAKAMLDCVRDDPLNGIRVVSREEIARELIVVNKMISTQWWKDGEAHVGKPSDKHVSFASSTHLDSKDYLPRRSSIPETVPAQQLRITNPNPDDATMGELDMSQLQLHSPKRSSETQTTLLDSGEKRRRVDEDQDHEESRPLHSIFDRSFVQAASHRPLAADAQSGSGLQLQHHVPILPNAPSHALMDQPPISQATSTGPNVAELPGQQSTTSARDPTDPNSNQTFSIYNPAWQTRFTSSSEAAYETPAAARHRNRSGVTVDDYLRRLQARRSVPPSHIDDVRNSRQRLPTATRTAQTSVPQPAPAPVASQPPASNNRRSPDNPERVDAMDVEERLLELQHIQLDKMMCEFSTALNKRCDNILYPAHLFHTSDPIPTNLIDTLMCLGENEWKYLPLWADGLDDGTGGVFDEANVPNLEDGGFRGGRRGMKSADRHARNENDDDEVVSLSTDTNSTFDDIQSEAMSTVGKASKNATDGTETVKSMVSDMSSESEFMEMNDVYKQIMDEKMSHDHDTAADVDKGKTKAAAIGHNPATNNVSGDVVSDDDDGSEEFEFDQEDGNSNSTIMGAGSDDVQGDMFYDLDDDDDDDDDDDKEAGNESGNGNVGEAGHAGVAQQHPTHASELGRTLTAIPIRSSALPNHGSERAASTDVGGSAKVNAVAKTSSAMEHEDSDLDDFEIV